MVWVFYLILLAVDVVGLILAAFTLPGLWLMLGAAAVFALITRTHGYLGVKSLVLLLVLAAGSEIAEFFLGGAGAKKAGATRWGIAGALVGGILGGIFLTAFIPIPIIGTIVGICLGSFLGAFGIEMVRGQTLHQSALIGVGAAKGRLYGIVSKVAIGIVMFIVTFIAAMPIHGRVIPGKAAPTSRPTTTSTVHF